MFTLSSLTDWVFTIRLIVTLVAGYALYFWYIRLFHTRRIQTSPYLNNQSVLDDRQQGIRSSILADEFPKDDTLITYYDIFVRGMQISANKPCLGRRLGLDQPIKWWTYTEVDRRIRAVGSALHHFCDGDSGLEESSGTDRIIGIYGKNSPEWTISMIACTAYQFVSVPLYETLGPEAMDHVCQQTAPMAVVCDTIDQAKNILRWTRGSIRYLIINHQTEYEVEAFENRIAATPLDSTSTSHAPTKTKVFTFDRLVEIGLKHMKPTTTPDGEALCIIGYTSGSTGLPKGVLFSHVNCVLAAFSGVHILQTANVIADQPSHFSYLPLAHCYERINLATFLHIGGRIGFLTAEVSGLLQDLKDFEPTYFSTVPRVLMRVYNQVMQRVAHSLVLRCLLRWAIQYKLAEQNRGLYCKAGLLDYMFFRPLRQKTGNNMQVVVSASAPISSEVLDFTRAAFSCPVLECYGLTETGGVLTATLLGDMNAGHTGTPYLDFKVKLIDVPEMNLMVQRDGMGEICAKGAGCTKGYYKDNVMSKKLFEPDGFLLTGDIGVWTEQGSLKVVDRRKSFFKLSQGEYVTPKKVEELYAASLLVNHVFVDGDSKRSYVIVIVEPELEELRKRLTTPAPYTNGFTNGGGLIHRANGHSSRGADALKSAMLDADMKTETLCQHPSARKLVLDDLVQLGKRGGLKGFEQAKAIYLSPEPFSVNNGMLTATMKISRPNVRKYFSTVIQNLYAEYDD